MSDFHLGKNIVLEKNRLSQLATWLTDRNINVKYLIFTGDMIDAPTVQAQCILKLKKQYPSISEYLKPNTEPNSILPCICSAGKEFISFYNAQLRESTLCAMKQAGEIFLEFINQIGLDKKRVILCCGNHDRMRFAEEKELTCIKEQGMDEDTINKPFEAYDALCQIINDRLSHQTMIYPCDDMNFVIANSNWKTPVQNETNRMCINCESLSYHLTQLRQSDTFNRNHNLLIAHKPYDDFCESVKYPYTNESLTIAQIAERTTAAFLYGDKHSYSVKVKNTLKEFMCGLPLSFQGVRYNLLDFDPSVGFHSCSYILNDGNGWIKVPITDCIESIYNESRAYLKDFAFTLLTGNKSVPFEWDEVVTIMQNAHNKDTLVKLSELFSSFSELRQGQPTIEIQNNTLFAQLISLIESSALQAVSIKGRPGVGKSTFMTITYLYMLWLFSCGKTRFIPFYFNLDTVTTNLAKDVNSSCNVEAYISYCLEQFSDYLNNCLKLSKEYKLPLCLFIDGLEKSKILAPGNNMIEKRIYQLVETELQSTDRYLMCFNTHNSYNFEDSFEKINRFTYVLYMNRVRILPYKSEEQKQNMFLSSYLALKGIPADDIKLQALKKTLSKFRTPAIDLFFLHHCDEHIFKIQDNENIWDVLRTHLTVLENISDHMFKFRIDTIQHAAGLLFSQRKCYAEIVNAVEVKSLTIAEFLLFINSPIITNYLIASYYVQELTTYSNSSSTRIHEDSILYSFVPHELAILIRLILDEKGNAVNDILARFIDQHSKELNGYLYSTIAYLCGHLRTGDNANLINSLPKPDRKSNGFFALCHRRSYDLANAIYSDQKFPVENILIEFIDNETYRKFNRSYQLHYYQDISNNSIRNQREWDPHKPPQRGFDFRSSFLMLLSKLEPALQDAKAYPLMQLDLFTLCDLIYSRLQHMTSDGLFYSAKYNERNDSESEAIMNRIVVLLKKYNSVYGGKKSTNNRIGAYFSLMYAQFDKAKKSISKNKGKDVDIPYVSPCYDFEQILALSRLARVGWNIDIPGEIKPEYQPNYKIDPETGSSVTPIRETLMQHVMESVFIAQMFLPDTLPEEGYQKSEVISLLLFSELGKTEDGDYSPNYSNYNKRKNIEETCLAHMSILGALDGYATQPKLFQPLSSGTSININMRICWEIKMIQCEYKYYTLYKELKFNDERRTEFEADFEEPVTNICKSIREQLVLKNPNFKSYFTK